ncbi:MAG: hypothetical protein KGJ13_10880 [Patescibacteria group bacterium]|nr:hypothetical protein [Patescibacteria group bacterium]
MIALPEIALVSLIVMAWKRSGNTPKLEGERKNVYDNAIEYLTDPEKLRKLADAFEKEGYKMEATMLRKRADLRGMSDEKKKQNREILEKADKSENISALKKLAEAFDAITATGSAARVRKRIEFLENRAKSENEFEPFDKQPKQAEPSKPVVQEVKDESEDSTPVVHKAEIVESSPAIHGDEEK